MERWIDAKALRSAARLATAALAITLMGGWGLRPAGAESFAPQSDDWKGAKLDLSKWHLTAWGDAQQSEHSATIKDGALHIIAGGGDIWGDNDNGVFLWQPANGDFQATLEVRSIKMIGSTTPVGIMVRPSTDLHAPEVMVKAVPIGTHLQHRDQVGGDTGPGTSSSGSLPWGDGSGNGLVLLRLTRTGKTFVARRSDDGGKTWVSLHNANNADKDTVDVDMPDDVLVGIATCAVFDPTGTDRPTTEAVVGPFTFTETAARPTTNGLVALTAVTDKGDFAPGAFLVVKDKDGKEVATTKNDVTDPATSNTGSFFLPPGTYTAEVGETDMFNAGVPVPFEIKTGVPQEIAVTVGKAK